MCRWSYFLVVVAFVSSACKAGLVAAPASSRQTIGAPTSQPRQIYSAGNRYLIIEAWRDDLLHFEMASGTGDASKPIYTTPMVFKTDYPGPAVFNVLSNGVETSELKATVSANLCVTVFDKTRQFELNTTCPDNLEQSWKGIVVDSPSTQNAYGLGQYFAEQNADGDWIGRVWDPLSDSFGAMQRGFAGGANDYSMFPILYALGSGSNAYAMFVDQVYKQMWDFRSNPWTIGMWGDQIRWFVMSGADLPKLRRDYMDLTGRPPTPPKRSFGLWVSQFGFANWDEVHTTLADIRQQHFPIEGFAMDLQWFGGTFADPDHSRMGSLTWDEVNFPNYAAEIQRLKTIEGVNLMLIEEPYVSSTLAEHQELSDRGYLVRDCETCGPTYLNYDPWWGRGGMIDFTNPLAGDFWHDYRRQPLIDLGINDHWADLGEPEQYNSWAWYSGFPELGKHSQADVHNLFGFDWMASIARGYERHEDMKSPRQFLLSRTGTSGIQRFGVGMWSGDIGTNWGNLRSQMNAQMHMSMSGVDYYGSDVGGFQRNSGVVDGGPELLYTQWFAASAALDVPVRPHAWNLDHQRSTSPTQRGDLTSNLENLRQRYALIPYYYSLAVRATETGEPVFPPPLFYYQADPAIRRVGSEKMIGRDLLVALVADANAVSRDVYLPAGEWADFESGVRYQSIGQSLRAYPLYAHGYFHLPLFARAGAIIPMAQVDDATLNDRGLRSDGMRDDTLKLRVFVGGSGGKTSFDLSEDDGETNANKSGIGATTTITQELVNNVVTVTVAATTGSYMGMPVNRPYIFELMVDQREAASVAFDGLNIKDCSAASLGAELACFSNTRPGVVTIKTLTDMPVGSDKVVVATLQAVPPPSSSSVYFVCRNGWVDSGYGVYVAGSIPALGSWQPTSSVQLTSAGNGNWAAIAPNLPMGTAIEWKCIKRKHDGTGDAQWQTGANNVITTQPSGGYTGVAESRFETPTQ